MNRKFSNNINMIIYMGYNVCMNRDQNNEKVRVLKKVL